MNTTEGPSATAVGGSALSEGLGPLPEPAFGWLSVSNDDGRWRESATGERAFSAQQMRAYADTEVAAERVRWKALLEDRGRIHGESSRIYARLASAVRSGADDIVLGQLLRAEVWSRA